MVFNTGLKTDTGIIVAAVALTAVIIAVLYWSGRGDKLGKGVNRLFNRDNVVDAVVTWIAIYTIFLIFLGSIDNTLLERIIIRSGVDSDIYLALVGSGASNKIGSILSFTFLLVFGTLLFVFGLTIIILAITNGLFDLTVDVTNAFVVILWTISLVLIFLEINVMVFIALLGLVYVLISAV